MGNWSLITSGRHHLGRDVVPCWGQGGLQPWWQSRCWTSCKTSIKMPPTCSTLSVHRWMWVFSGPFTHELCRCSFSRSASSQQCCQRQIQCWPRGWLISWTGWRYLVLILFYYSSEPCFLASIRNAEISQGANSVSVNVDLKGQGFDDRIETSASLVFYSNKCSSHFETMTTQLCTCNPIGPSKDDWDVCGVLAEAIEARQGEIKCTLENNCE